jgi:hypothetical protein
VNAVCLRLAEPLRGSFSKITSMHKEHATEIPPPKRPVFPRLLTH